MSEFSDKVIELIHKRDAAQRELDAFLATLGPDSSLDDLMFVINARNALNKHFNNSRPDADCPHCGQTFSQNGGGLIRHMKNCKARK